MTKRKILFYLIVLGILFVVNLILIFWGKQIFKIKADAVPVCGSGPCVSNPSINFGFYWKRVPNAGAETLANEFNESKNAIAQQFKMITFAAGLSGSPDSYGETFQMVLDQAAQIKNLNPSRQVYSYRWTISKISQLDPDIVNKTLDPDGNNRQCFLRYQTGDKKGQPILLTGQGAYVMDVTSQCWKNYLANSINSQANLYGVNGVMFDGVMPALADTIAPYPQTITDTHLPANYAANWKANIQKLLTDVKAQIGDNKILWISKPCDYDGSDNDCSKDFIPYADGFMYERFSFWAQGSSPNIDVDYKSPAFLSVEQFKSNLDMAFTAQKQG
ncbi:MAG: putative glycoside hydrolase, partial [Patescibacteria group bacterium]|nr:putative glycoside hydrolase [Patescibacteria group bacterium]